MSSQSHSSEGYVTPFLKRLIYLSTMRTNFVCSSLWDSARALAPGYHPLNSFLAAWTCLHVQLHLIPCFLNATDFFLRSLCIWLHSILTCSSLRDPPSSLPNLFDIFVKFLPLLVRSSIFLTVFNISTYIITFHLPFMSCFVT